MIKEEAEVVHVLFASADNATGAITCQTGDVTSGEVSDDAATLMQSWGLLSLPSVPVSGQSAPEAVVLKRSGPDIIIGGRTVRTAEIAGLIKQGETCVFADGSRASTLYKLDGSVVHYCTHDNTIAGRAVASTVGPDGFEWSWPWGRLWFDKTGFHVTHSSGASFDLGSIAGAPSPLDTLGTYISMTGAIVRINGTAVSIGADPPATPDPLVRTTPTVAVLNTLSAALSGIQSALSSIQAVVDAVPAGTTPSPTGGGAAVLAAAITAANVAIGSAGTSVAAAAASVGTAQLTIASASTGAT